MESDQLWQETAQMRAAFLEQQFGPLPENIQKLVNLMEIWPGGGIYQMAAPRLGGMGVCVTHGLTNADMPARFPADESRPTREMAAGLAGYGYELLVLTPQPDPWPLLTLSWFIQMEILNNLCLLERVAAGNGASVEGAPIGDGRQQVNLLVQPACSPVLARINLPAGLMHLLIATTITPDELEFARTQDNGCFELLNRLVDAKVGPVSRLDRPSVLASN